jgi:hypothetical protein
VANWMPRSSAANITSIPPDRTVQNPWLHAKCPRGGGVGLVSTVFFITHPDARCRVAAQRTRPRAHAGDEIPFLDERRAPHIRK